MSVTHDANRASGLPNQEQFQAVCAMPRPASFAYADNSPVDARFGLIVDVKASRKTMFDGRTSLCEVCHIRPVAMSLRCERPMKTCFCNLKPKERRPWTFK